MPTLDDAPSLNKATALVATDLVQIYKSAEHPTGAKPITAANFFAGIPDALTEPQEIALITALLNSLPTSAGAVGTYWLDAGVVTKVQA